MAAPASVNDGGILVFADNVELVGELLTAGFELAGGLQLPVTVAAIGGNAQSQLAEGLACGAGHVLVVNLTHDSEESIATGLCSAIRATNPAVVLVGATRMGAGIAARAGQMLQIPCVSNCIALELHSDGYLRVERRAYGGQFVSRQLLRSGPRLVTVPPRCFPQAMKVAGASGRITEISVTVPPPRLKIVSVSQRTRSPVDITKAEVIVGAGRGVQKIEDLQLLEQLARLLDGALAGSRPLTGDVDWLPMERRIGLSGQTVKPRLYIACGISGQIEHIVGMKGARTVVAINNDRNAPIHIAADYSVIGDLYQVVPALIQACERAKGKPDPAMSA